MAQDYNVLAWNPWQDKTTGQDVRDPHGNLKGSLLLSGLADAVDATFKNPPEVGKTIYGHVEDYETRSGATRQRFKRDIREQLQVGNSGSSVGGSGYSKHEYKDNSDGMRQGMCFNNAAHFIATTATGADRPITPEEWANVVYSFANALYAKGDLGGSEDTNPKPVTQTTSNPARLKQGDPVWPSDDDPEFASMVSKGFSADDLEIPEGF